MGYRETSAKWLNHDGLALELKKELELVKDNEEEIRDRFYKSLEFGTGGLRGVIGAGTNRMNVYVVRKATQGLANYLKSHGDVNNGVVIAYDSRHKSREFAKEAALVLAKNQIKAHVFKEITPTPILSFAVRELGAIAGIVITASHNPKEYNGYKVYGSDGGQITDNLANAITEEINKVKDELAVNVMDEEAAVQTGYLNWLDEEVLNSYIEKTKELILRADVIDETADNFSIVYTPLHGTGYIPVTRVLKEAGFKNVTVVPEQALPDPDFSTVKYPNPEEHKAFDLALQLAQKVDADIVMGTDPDADRVGVVVKDDKGKYIVLTGNQLGALLIDYILQMRHYRQNIPDNAVVVKTIVTSSMGVNIAKRYGVGYIDVLTGFKYIGEKIEEFHKDQSHTFLFGYEESYGYLIGDYVRDKDAVQACLVTAEMAAYYKTKGMTLYDRLQQLFKENGYYKEDLVSFNLAGIEGQERIKRILTTFRDKGIVTIKNEKVVIIRDYLTGMETNLLSSKTKSLDLPQSNVIHYTLEDGSWFCIRPSGTEPKLKIYFSVKGHSASEAEVKLAQLKKVVVEAIESMQ
jgi:phosphoglucomutase